VPGRRRRLLGALRAVVRGEAADAPRPPPAPPASELEVLGRWPAAALGLPEHATFRCLLPLPGGGMALGSDYGMALWRGGAFEPFPFPEGARRESRRVESMAVYGGVLYLASAKNWYTWPFEGEAAGRGLPRDEHGVVDDLRCFHVSGGRLITAWRTRMEGADGPPDAICFTESPAGTWAGTIDGGLYRLDPEGATLVRRFSDADGKPWPVRYLAWTRGGLWVAAGRALHRLEGDTWTSREGEPYALLAAADDRLWTLRAGALWVDDGRWTRRVEAGLTRPWSLGQDAGGALWIGELGRVSRVRPAPGGRP
jgi:hypothetical protein